MDLEKMLSTTKEVTIDDLIACLKKYNTAKEIELVRLAYDYAEQAHTGQTRKSGEPYIQHPLMTAYILAYMRFDLNLVAAGILHDVPEDTPITIEDVEKNFGEDIANLIKGITKLGKLKYRGVERYIENLRKMFVAMAEDVRVMIIKFADRIHNLSTIEALPEKKRYRIALESLEIYAPIANRLGMNEIKGMLEDLSFKHVYPKEYEKVKALRERIVTGQEAYISKIIKNIKSELFKSGFKTVEVQGRQKQLYSLYQKLMQKGWDTENIYDIFALRVLVQDVGDCYAALGIIHKIWRPIKGRIKDYIAQPKPNGYQSLHTTVFCDDGKMVEFQIRTIDMHNDAEYGIAAHWHYDENGVRIAAHDIQWAKELARLQKEVLNNLSDLEEIKIDFFQNRIFVFTPKGDVIDLPENATPIDFAYHIHTDIGNKCGGAKINDQIVSLDTALKSGDVIEIIVDKNRKGPSPNWLKFVKTHVARNHIKNNLNSAVKNWLKIILPNRER